MKTFVGILTEPNDLYESLTFKPIDPSLPAVAVPMKTMDELLDDLAKKQNPILETMPFVEPPAVYAPPPQYGFATGSIDVDLKHQMHNKLPAMQWVDAEGNLVTPPDDDIPF